MQSVRSQRPPRAESSPTVGRKRADLDPNISPYKREFATRLRELMDRKPMSIKELAEALTERGWKVTPDAVGTWVAGKSIPEAENLPHLAAELLPSEDYRLLLPSESKLGSRRRRK
jgi:hypothetical protein